MNIGRTSSTVDIAISGLRARATQMDVLANNIANANTARTDSGLPYRRQAVVFSTLMDGLQGIGSVQVTPDMSREFKRVYEPGHPAADGEGYVLMPNVDIPLEMMHMVTASRAYQANAAVLKRYQESVNVALELLR